MIKPSIKLKEENNILANGICSHSIIHLTSFLYYYTNDYFGLKKGDNYYYDINKNYGAIIKLDKNLDYIKDKNPYLLIYFRLD